MNLDILFGEGIDSVGCTLDAAEDLGVVDRKGSWYAFNGENVAQGRLNVIELMKTDQDLCSEIELRVKEALTNFGKDPEDDSTVEEEATEALEDVADQVSENANFE